MQPIDSSRPSRHRARRRLALVFVALPIAGLFGGAIATTAQAAPAAAFSFGDRPADAVHTAASHHVCQNLTADSLAAMAITVTFNETGAGADQTPSPMTLSRSDDQSALHAFKQTGTGEDRAFWHPGVGAFQLDSAGVGRNTDAAGAIDVSSAADIATASMASTYCGASGPDAAKRKEAWKPWVGCTRNDCETIFNDIFQGGKLTVTRDSAVTNTGGMQARTCSRGGVNFRCWFVDPNRAQGHTAWRSPGFGPSPITLPFYVFTSSRSGKQVEERHWLMADTGFNENVSATRPYGTDARDTLNWAHSSDIKVVSNTDTPPPAFPPLPRTVPKAGGRDFTGDKKSDIFWYGAGNTADSVWAGTATPGTFATPKVDQVTGTYVPIGGDFDGNGIDDVFWYGVGGPDSVWYGTGNAAFNKVKPTDGSDKEITIDGYNTPIVGDFDGDGRDDIFWYARDDAADVVWYGTTGGHFAKKTTTNVSFTGYSPISGDFDGDGRDDIFWYGPADATDSIWRGTSRRTFVTVTAVKQVSGNYSPVSGDFNGDGRDDIFWYAGGNDVDTLWLSNGDLTFKSVAETVNGLYVPIAGDFNGDGKDDIFWYGPGSEADSVWTSTGTSGAFNSTGETVNGADYRYA